MVLPTVVLGCALIGILRQSRRTKENEENGENGKTAAYNLSTYTNYVVNIDEEEAKEPYVKSRSVYYMQTNAIYEDIDRNRFFSLQSKRFPVRIFLMIFGSDF